MAVEDNIQVTQEEVDAVEPVDVEITDEAVEPEQVQEEAQDFYVNLAEGMDERILAGMANELLADYKKDKESRSDWEKSYTSGLDLLGFKYNNESGPFQGASSVTHPMLAESVTQFQAQAYKELLPSDGPVSSKVVGALTPEKEAQAQRVEEFMNYMITEEMEEYTPDFDQLLFYLPLAGSAFKKVYFDDVLQRAISKFVPAEDLVVPYYATDLKDCERITHLVRMSENDILKKQQIGFYRDVDILPSRMEDSEVQDKYNELSGQNRSGDADGDYQFNVLEMHVDLDLVDPENKSDEKNIKIPYIVTLDEGSREILSIYRNFEPDDPLLKRKEFFVHYKFLPGLGFYGFGLIHMIGGLSRTATSALRQLLDAGTLSNLPAGFKQRGIRIRDDAQAIQPGEFRDVDAPGGNIRDSFMMLPFKEPSQTLLQLMGVVVNAGQRFASIADLQVGDGNQQAAVGTTVALLERGSRTMSAIHKRIYAALKNEFKLLARVFKLYLPTEYPYDVVGGQRMIKQQDFDDRVDILPVADPNIFSQTQRISLAQTELQLATSNPGIHNQYAVYRNMYEALGVKDIDKILIRPQPPQPKDPALEHIDALAGKPFQAFPGQDHRAHMTAHLNFMATNIARNNPVVMASLEKNIFEHISLMAQEQVEVEFRNELQQLQQMQMAMQQNPQMAQQMQMQVRMLTEKIESRKAVLIAEMMEEFMKEEKEITSQFDNDPIAKLRARELDLRAQENYRKEQEAKERINLDKMKSMMNQMNQEEKLEQNEDLAHLRADTSLTKTVLQHELKNKDKM